MKKIFLKILSVFSFMCMFMFNVNIIGGIQDNNRPKVSIIVPVYNVEKWLPECMDSLVNQTLKDIEIICVNDGSTDNCGKILNEYAKKDKEKFKKERIKVINQENQGVSVARNAGIDIASGEYITFVDSDDYVHPKTYETAYKWAKKDDVDVLRFNFRHFKDGRDNFNVNDIDLNDASVLSLKDYWTKTWSNSSCNQLFKYGLIQSDKIRFDNKMWYGEDACFNFISMAKARRIKYIPGKFYNYRNRLGSATKKNEQESVRNVLPIFKNVCDSWRKRKCLKGHESLLLMVLIRWMSNMNLEYFLKYSDKILNSFGTDIYNKKVIKECPEKVQSIIKQLEQAAEKQKKKKFWIYLVKRLCKPELMKKYPKWIKNEIKCLENAVKKSTSRNKAA